MIVPPEDRPPVTNQNCETLPKTLPGVVCAQWRTCGKPACRCARGQRHGPYLYRFWRQGGRLRKRYVPRADLDVVRGRCQARLQERADCRAALERIRALAAFLRAVERS